MERLRVLDNEGITWVEEPALAHDYAGHARGAREARTPIQCGENWWGTLDMQHALEARASDFVMPDVMKIGGVTGWLTAAALAHSKGIPVSNHLWLEISARLLCCTPTRIGWSMRTGGARSSSSRYPSRKAWRWSAMPSGQGSTGMKTRCAGLRPDPSCSSDRLTPILPRNPFSRSQWLTASSVRSFPAMLR